MSSPGHGSSHSHATSSSHSTEHHHPVEAVRQRLHQFHRPECYRHGHRPSFSSAYARAAQRYGFDSGRHAGFALRNNVVCKVHHNTKETEHEVAAESIQNGELLAPRARSLEYVVPVTIGTPGITLHLDFDTGSSDLWVWSSEIAHASSYGAHRIYNPRKSSSAKHTTSTWKISYGDGSSASGHVYLDTVTVAGVRIPEQAVEVAHDVSPAFLKDGGNDGLLGLAWPSINTVQPHRVATPVQNMIKSALIDPPLFTAKLGHGTEPSFYSFGYIDPTVTKHHIHYIDVDNSQGFWQVPSHAYSINGKEYDTPGNTAILDTGTSLCLVHDDVVEKIYSRVEGARYHRDHGGWVYPTDAKLPEVCFAAGHYLFRVHRRDFGFGNVGNGYTLGGIQSRGTSKFDILGDVFLRCVYVVFNQGEKTVGVAQRDD